MMWLQYYGKSCFCFYDDNCGILINPDLSQTSLDYVLLNKNKIDLILLTKYSKKMFADALLLLNETDAKVICGQGMVDLLVNNGIERDRIEPVYVGQFYGHFGNKILIKFVPSISNSNLPGTLAMGAVIDINGVKIYYDGYTAYYSDLKLLKEYNVDYALISMGQWTSKDITEVFKTLQDIKPKYFIPMQYHEIEKEYVTAFRDTLLKQNELHIVPIVLDPCSRIIIKQ